MATDKIIDIANNLSNAELAELLTILADRIYFPVYSDGVPNCRADIVQCGMAYLNGACVQLLPME